MGYRNYLLSIPKEEYDLIKNIDLVSVIIARRRDCAPDCGYGMPQHLRITIGTEAQNTRCIAALQKVLAA